MRALGEYIVSVTAAGFVCAVISAMMPKGTAKEILRLVGGLFLAFSVIRSIADIRIPELIEMGYALDSEAQTVAAEGTDMAQEAIDRRIKQELEAYILDKAESLGLSLTVEVALEGNLPDGAVLKGSASPVGRQQMMRYLTEELGIQEESIQWTP